MFFDHTSCSCFSLLYHALSLSSAFSTSNNFSDICEFEIERVDRIYINTCTYFGICENQNRQ